MKEITVWLSFVSPDKGFLGVNILKIEDTGNEKSNVKKAIELSHFLKINPGGEVAVVFIEKEFVKKINKNHFNKLLTKKDIIEGGYINGG